MKYLHTMFRIRDVDRALKFWTLLGLKVTRQQEYPQGKFTLIFLATEVGEPEIELTYNWDQSEEYTYGRNFGHVAFRVDNIYETCERLMKAGVVINRPPRDGHMAFVKSPDNQSVEILQEGTLPPQEPWVSMPNTGTW
ncbi:MAG: VOC family protein [Bacteriovoracaceae bacterium]|nr:VOC family protein [Bacteriovoracaceae bacterium]